MTAGKASDVNDHREMASRRHIVQGPGWCEGRGEKYTGRKMVPEYVWYRKRSCLALTSHASLCITDLQKKKHKIVFWMKLAPGISFFRLLERQSLTFSDL